MLTFSYKVTGQNRGVLRNCHLKGTGKKTNKRTVRSQIRAHLSHPNLSRVNRHFTYNSLHLIDRYKARPMKNAQINFVS